MDKLEQTLRDELRQMPQSVPNSAAMLGRVRRRRAQGRWALAGAVGVVLVLTVGVGFALRNEPGVELPPPAGPVSGSVKVADGEYPHFSDPGHGFVLAYSCDPMPCSTYVASTVDGGASWQLHPVPSEAGKQAEDHAPRAELRVFDSNNVLLDSYDRERRWASSDGAKTWREMPVHAGGTIDKIPSGAQVRAQADARGQIGIVVTRPDGNSFFLVHAPNILTDSARGEITVAPDGSYWYEESNQINLWLFYSRDQGRTWNELKPPGERPTGIGPRGLMTHDGRTVYWYYHDKAWRTIDDGAHWTEIRVPSVSTGEGDHGMLGEVRRDNGLQFTDSADGKVFVVSALSTTFVPVATPDPAAVPPFRGVRYAQQSDGVVSHSIDGVNWIEIRFTS